MSMSKSEQKQVAAQFAEASTPLTSDSDQNYGFIPFYGRAANFLVSLFDIEYTGGLPKNVQFDYDVQYPDNKTMVFCLTSGEFKGDSLNLRSQTPIVAGTFNEEGHLRVKEFFEDLRDIGEQRFVSGINIIDNDDYMGLLIKDPSELLRLIKGFMHTGSTKSIDSYKEIRLTRGGQTIESEIERRLKRAEKNRGLTREELTIDKMDISLTPPRVYISPEHAHLATLAVDEIGCHQDFIVYDSLASLEACLRQCKGLPIQQEYSIVRSH